MERELLDEAGRDGLTPLQFTLKRNETKTQRILEDRQAGFEARASETEQLDEMRDR